MLVQKMQLLLILMKQLNLLKEQGVDSLAIAIGTSHGAYKFKGEPRLDFERLRKNHKTFT